MKTSHKIVAGGFIAALAFYGLSIFINAAYQQGRIDGTKENIEHVVQVNKQAKKEREEGVRADWVKVLAPDGRAYYRSDLAAPTYFVEQMDYVSFDKGIYAFTPASFDIFEIFFIVHNRPDDGVKFEVPAQKDPEDDIPEGKYGGKFRLL